MVLILLLISTLMGGPQPPRSFWILYWLLFTGGAIASRIVLRDVLIHHLDQWKNNNPGDAQGDATLIYGAGSSGMGLLLALRNDPRFRIVAFLDDDEGLQGRTLQNMAIHSPLRLPRLIERHGIRKVLLAMPTISRLRKRLLVDQLTHSGLEVLSIPSLAQMASGQRIVSDLQAVAIEDLLGREPSYPDPMMLKASVKGKVVMVTGAGGSIGSELCRQIVALGASRLLAKAAHTVRHLSTVEKVINQIGHAAEITTAAANSGQQLEVVERAHQFAETGHGRMPSGKRQPKSIGGAACNMASIRYTFQRIAGKDELKRLRESLDGWSSTGSIDRSLNRLLTPP
jgi:FlaA1/EpsC-like NDP-sugar epimerase